MRLQVTDQLFVCFVEHHKRVSLFKDNLAHWLKNVIAHTYLNRCQEMHSVIKCHSEHATVLFWVRAELVTSSN